MNNLHYEPTKDDLVYFAKRVIAALDVHCRGWRNTTPRCPTYPDRAADIIRQFAALHREAVLAKQLGADRRRMLNDAYNRLEAELDRQQASRVFAHTVKELGKRDRSFYQTEKAQEAVRRVPDSGPAHGLRQHSIGSTYPCVVVGSIVDGVTHYHVEFGGYRSYKTREGKRVQRWASYIAQEYRTQGWTSAVEYFKGEYFCKGPVERRYE